MRRKLIAKDELDIYNSICIKLRKLCPRLVPEPLWSLTLANISTIAPELGLLICDGCDEIIKKIHDYWIGLNRKGKCEVCGSEASEIDEDWRYYVYYENKPIVHARKIDRLDLLEKLSGIAYLKGLLLLCEKFQVVNFKDMH